MPCFPSLIASIIKFTSLLYSCKFIVHAVNLFYLNRFRVLLLICFSSLLKLAIFPLLCSIITLTLYEVEFNRGSIILVWLDILFARFLSLFRITSRKTSVGWHAQCSLASCKWFRNCFLQSFWSQCKDSFSNNVTKLVLCSPSNRQRKFSKPVLSVSCPSFFEMCQERFQDRKEYG